MKKRIARIVLPVMLLSLLWGCGEKTPPVETGESTLPSTTCADAETTAPEQPAGPEDTFWIARAYYDGETEKILPVEAENWYMDLIIRADGTARFRDVFGELCIMDDDGLHLRWELDGNTLRFYNDSYDYPLLEGTWGTETLELRYRDMPLRLTRDSMPRTVGERYSPAQLQGTWVAVLAENEGYEWEILESGFESLVFWVDSSDEEMTLVADKVSRDYYGDVVSAGEKLPLEVLQEPLYTDCENESWSVRLVEEDSGEDRGTYVTLIDENVLLLQNYFSIEGAPAVSYMTYWRMPPALSWWEVKTEDLTNTNWYCASYLDIQGNSLEIPPEFKDRLLQFGDGNDCYVDGTSGNWILSGGGGILLASGEETQTPFRYGGAIRASYAGGSDPFYEMYLYFEGGVLRFLIDSYG